MGAVLILVIIFSSAPSQCELKYCSFNQTEHAYQSRSPETIQNNNLTGILQNTMNTPKV